MELQERDLVRRYLSEKILQSRAQGEVWVYFRVWQVCDDLGLTVPNRYSMCCEVLDSEDFAREERVDYHHRTGVWGTRDALYIFLVRPPARASANKRGFKLWSITKVVLGLMAVGTLTTAIALAIWRFL